MPFFNPRTGCSPAELSCVAVRAPSFALADALTKVMFAAGRDGALRVARESGIGNRESGVDVLVVDKQGKRQAAASLKLHAV